MYDLYLDSATRQIVNLLPDGTPWPAQPSTVTETTISDADAQRIHAAWVTASQAGQQLIVATDLTTSVVTPGPTAYQQAVQTCSAYLNDSNLDTFLTLTASNPPTAAQNLYVAQHTVATLRALTRIVRSLAQDS